MPGELPENPEIPQITPVLEAATPPNSPTTEPKLASPPSSSAPKPGRKGLILAAIIGVSVLVIVGVLAFSLKNSSKETGTPSRTNSPAQTEGDNLVMQVSNLSDNTVVTSKSLPIKGNTKSPATVTITGGAEDLVIESTGTFSADVSLQEGTNSLVFTALDKDENQKVLTKEVLFSLEAGQ